MNDQSLVSYQKKLYFIRGTFVMLDRDLALFYGVDVKVFNKAMKRHENDLGENTNFLLTKDEYLEILNQEGNVYTGGHLPRAYTEKAAYKMAFFLSSKTAIRVADIIMEVFISVKDELPSNDKRVLVLERELKIIKENMGGLVIHNHYNGPIANLNQGGSNTISIGNKDDVILKIIEILNNKEVVANKALTDLLAQAITLASKKDKKGLIESLKAIGDLGSGISGLTGSIPIIIEAVSKLF